MTIKEHSRAVETIESLPEYRNILLATDSSDHANQGSREAASIANLWGGAVTGAHVYAAKMHDIRFRQMEGGLPERFREEQELERQRDVHDDLITRGLSVITDSYLDQVDRLCAESGISFKRRSLEGKNYRELVREANSGEYDLVIMGALGLGATAGSRLGGVCNRVARRTDVDLLMVKEPGRSIAEGSFVVAVDGSPKSFGALLMAISLARNWDVKVNVVAAFDPYYHYVAFNRIAGVLSEEAGKVFRFKEQEKLHEEIIDSGLAKIYQGHLDVAVSIANDYGVEIETQLLDGKPHDAIARYLRQTKPSLLLLGKTGIHADPDLDIGGNTENLIYRSDCAVLMTQREYRPAIDVLADVTTSWTRQAEERMEKVPGFVRAMARMAILRYAQEHGHTVITDRIVEDATAQLMPGRAEGMMQQVVDAYDEISQARQEKGSIPDLGWTHEARVLLDNRVEDDAVRRNIEHRAVKKARGEGSKQVEASHVQAFLSPDTGGDADNAKSGPAFHWQAAALARLMRVPDGFMREMSKQRIEEYVESAGSHVVTLELAEQGLAKARLVMQENLEERTENQRPVGTPSGRCPFANLASSMGNGTRSTRTGATGAIAAVEWEQDAGKRLEKVPEGYCRDMTRRAVETIAAQQGGGRIDAQSVEAILKVFENGSQQVSETLEWTGDARSLISRAPDMVRGMLIREIEAVANRDGKSIVDAAMVEVVRNKWMTGGVFHLDPEDPRNRAT